MQLINNNNIVVIIIIIERKENGDKAPYFLGLEVLVKLTDYTGNWVDPRRVCFDVAEKRKIHRAREKDRSVVSQSLTVVS